SPVPAQKPLLTDSSPSVTITHAPGPLLTASSWKVTAGSASPVCCQIASRSALVAAAASSFNFAPLLSRISGSKVASTLIETGGGLGSHFGAPGPPAACGAVPAAQPGA